MIALFVVAVGYLIINNDQSEISDEGMNNAAGTMIAGSDMNAGLIGGDAVAPEETEGETSYSVIYDTDNGFNPSTLYADVGDVVSINLRSASGTTNLLIDELGVVTPVMTPDSGDTTVRFTVENAGTYRMYGVWNDELTAEGELIVE